MGLYCRKIRKGFKMRKIVNYIISRLKHEDYKLDPNISILTLISICFNKLIMAIRGLFHKVFLKQKKGILFIGKQVKIKSHRKILIEGTATIEDNCYINAMSYGGLKIGNNFTLGRNSIIECTGVIRNLGEGIVIGNNVGISANAFIGARGKLIIGDDTIIGPGVSIHSENHIYDDIKTLIRLQGEKREGISIGKNCWIGSKVVILDGVTIGDGCVIAAGAVVTKDIEENSVVGGVPAKVLKKRK